MNDLRSPSEVTFDALYTMVRSAVRNRLDAETVADFVASVDWTDATAADQRLLDALGRLELWTTEYREGDLTAQVYRERLLSLLPAAERTSR